MTSPQPVSLDVQVVLYHSSLRSVWQLLHALSAAVAVAGARGALGRCRLLLGDCGTRPSLGPADLQALEEAAVEHLDELVFTFFGENLGSAGGSNRLAALGTGELLLILNPDTYVAPTLLVEMTAVFGDREIAVADAKQLPLEHPKHYDPRRGDTSWASGSCMMVRRAVFESVGGFDTDHFFLYCDDVDLSWRARLQEHRVVHVPTALVFHDKRISEDGRVEPTDSEGYYGVLGRLMLAHRYDRPDVVRDTIASVEASGSAGQWKALQEYWRREAQDLVPEPLPGAATVAQFVDGEYAAHRF